MAYSKSHQGERLLATYAYGTGSVKIVDLTWLIPVIEQISARINDTIKTVNIDGGRYLFRQGDAMAGFETVSKYPFYRGNTLQITQKGIILAFADYRAKPVGNCRIQPILARSDDGGYNWKYMKVVDRPAGENTDPNLSRLMDPTSLYDPRSGKIWLLLGRWLRGGGVWNQANETSASWEGALLAVTDNNGESWTSSLINKSTVSSIPATCKGLIGGVGSGIVMADGTLVLPVQWTKGDGVSHPSILYSSNQGSTWTLGSGFPHITAGNFQSGENMVIENPSGSLYMLCRGPAARISFLSTNKGQTWTRNNKYDLGWGANCQGTFVKIVTKNKVTAVIATAVTNNDRSGITLFVYPSQGPPQPLSCINVAISGGYSSVAYMNSPNIGERLLVTYECKDEDELVNGQSVKIKDITYLIPSIEKIATSTFPSS